MFIMGCGPVIKPFDPGSCVQLLSEPFQQTGCVTIVLKKNAISNYLCLVYLLCYWRDQHQSLDWGVQAMSA